MRSIADLMMRLQYKLWAREQFTSTESPVYPPLPPKSEEPAPDAHPLSQLQFGDVFYESEYVYPAFPNYVLEREGDRLLYFSLFMGKDDRVTVIKQEGGWISTLARSAFTVQRDGELHRQILEGVAAHYKRELAAKTAWQVAVMLKNGHERIYSHTNYAEAEAQYVELRQLWIKSNVPNLLKSVRMQKHFLGEMIADRRPSATYDFREVCCVALRPVTPTT